MLIDKMNGNIYINSSNDKIPFCEFIIELPVLLLKNSQKQRKDVPMYSPSVLIISKRRELAVKYKKIQKILNADPVMENNLTEAIGKIRNKEFEFILFSDTF